MRKLKNNLFYLTAEIVFGVRIAQNRTTYLIISYDDTKKYVYFEKVLWLGAHAGRD